MTNKILRFFGQILGMKTEKSPEEMIKKYEEDIQRLNQQITERTLGLQEYKVQLAKKEEELEKARQITGDIRIFSKALKELEKEISESKDKNLRKEKEIKAKIKNNKWVLGLDCQVKAKEQAIDPKTALDLHIKTDLNEDRIFEFKSANIEPFIRKKENSRLHINPELSEGINQIIDYMKKTEIYSNLEEEGTYKIKKPSGVVVIGYKLSKAQENLLKNWSFHLRPHIRIITYDDLLESASQNLEHIKCVRND